MSRGSATPDSTNSDTAEMVAAVRRMVAPLADFPARWREGVRFIPASADGVGVEWVVADGASTERRIVHCHGGGWVAGGVDTCRGRGAALSRLAQATVLLVDYRLAPEHPFPAGLDDCDTALRWAFENGPGGVSRASQVTLSGDSAGAALAAALCARTIETGQKVPDRLILLSGQLSVAAQVDRVARNDHMVFQENLWHAYLAYTAASVPPDDPRVSPLFTPRSVLEGFPPTLLQVSGDELFFHDARVFTSLLAEVGRRHTLSVWPGMPHCWHARLDDLPEAEIALREVADFIS